MERGRKMTENSYKTSSGCIHYFVNIVDKQKITLVFLPGLLICGEKDKAGSAKSYNKKWHQREGLPLKWIKNAGHNSNTDQPDEVNRLIEKFIRGVECI